jgi:integrase
VNNEITLYSYFAQWIETYKKGAIRSVTLEKYYNDLRHVEELAPELKLSEIDRTTYQQLINAFAETHEKVTVMDFHHHIKAVLLDAIDDGHLTSDPTRRVVIKGRSHVKKHETFLSRYELETVLRDLNLGPEPDFDWLILLIAKTGMRFSEALAITPEDFDFKKQRLSISKTWDYKNGGGFAETKNKSSVRNIQIDWQTAMQFSQICEGLPADRPIFVKADKSVYNSTVNDRLAMHCKAVSAPVITIHGLRHTHASLLLGAGVSIASVSQRLGHSNMATTQKVYLHIIRELEAKDAGIIMTALTGLGG